MKRDALKKSCVDHHDKYIYTFFMSCYFLNKRHLLMIYIFLEPHTSSKRLKPKPKLFPFCIMYMYNKM